MVGYALWLCDYISLQWGRFLPGNEKIFDFLQSQDCRPWPPGATERRVLVCVCGCAASSQGCGVGISVACRSFATASKDVTSVGLIGNVGRLSLLPDVLDAP